MEVPDKIPDCVFCIIIGLSILLLALVLSNNVVLITSNVIFGGIVLIGGLCFNICLGLLFNGNLVPGLSHGSTFGTARAGACAGASAGACVFVCDSDGVGGWKGVIVCEGASAGACVIVIDSDGGNKLPAPMIGPRSPLKR